MSAILRSVMPFIPAGPDIRAALDFYQRILGFRLLWENGGFAGVGRDGVELILQQIEDKHSADNFMLSITVTEIDELAVEYAARDFSPGKLGKLEIKPWGKRELHVIDHYGVCLHFVDADYQV